MGSKENWDKLTELMQRVGEPQGAEPMGQLQVKLQVYMIAQQEQHYQDLRGMLQDLTERVNELSQKQAGVVEVEAAIKKIRKELDNFTLTEKELPLRIKELVALELERHAQITDLGKELTVEARRVNERFTEQFIQRENKELAKLRSQQPVKQLAPAKGKLPVRSVPDGVLNARERALAQEETKPSLRLLLAYRILRLTGMRVGNLLKLDARWFEEELKEESVRYPLIKQGRGKEYCEVYMSKAAREETQKLYRRYLALYGEQPFSVGRERLTKALNEDLKKTGIPGITSHALRSNVITKIVKTRGAAIAQQFMRHRNISTTARYVGNLLPEAMQRSLGELLESGISLRSSGPNQAQRQEGSGETRARTKG